MSDKLVFKFAGLGYWRKLYLVLQWVAAILVAGFILILTSVSAEPLPGILIVWSVVLLFIAYWTHTAVVERSIKQLKILMVVNVLLANPVGLLVMISVHRHSKGELEMHGLPLA